MEDVVDIIFAPADAVGGALGLLVQTVLCVAIGVAPGSFVRLNIGIVLLMPVGFLLLLLAIPLALSIGILIYCLGAILIGVVIGSALREVLIQGRVANG